MSVHHSSLDQALAGHAVHEVSCVACQSAHVTGNANDEGLWYGYCVICGTRFWALLHVPPQIPGYQGP